MKPKKPQQAHKETIRSDRKPPDRGVAILVQRYEELLCLRKKVEDLTKEAKQR